MTKKYRQEPPSVRRHKTIEGITDYIIANKGPDDEGRAHPRKKRILYKDLNAALKAAQDKGFCKDVKPYHFPNTMYMYKHSWIVDEIIVKKIDQLLKEKYREDVIELIKNVTAKELQEPLIDVVNGKPIKVSTRRVGMLCSDKKYNSPFEEVNRYLELKGLKKKLKNLKPYHFNQAPNSTYHNPAFVDEVLIKKIDTLLNEKYEGSLIQFIKKTGKNELLEPLIDNLCGKPIKVSMRAAGNRIGDKQQSPYLMVSRYLELKGLGNREDLKILINTHIRNHKKVKKIGSTNQRSNVKVGELAGV